MKVKVAATQMSCSWEIEENITKAKKIIHDASDQGANIILITRIISNSIFLY